MENKWLNERLHEELNKWLNERPHEELKKSNLRTIDIATQVLIVSMTFVAIAISFSLGILACCSALWFVRYLFGY